MTYLTVKTLSPLDTGHLAGIIDGEDTIIITQSNQNKQRGLVITVNSTEMSNLKHVQEITEVGKITNKRATKANHTPSFTYHVANRQALDLLKHIAAHIRSYKGVLNNKEFSRTNLPRIRSLIKGSRSVQKSMP